MKENDIKTIGKGLLKWLQDRNLPIYQEIVEIVILRQYMLISDTKRVLKSNDSIWILNLLIDVSPELNEKNVQTIIPELKEMVKNLTKDKYLDEDELKLVKIARFFMKNDDK